MKQENSKSLENLSRTCNRSGILPIFLGILILFVGVVNKEVMTLLIGIFIFIVGYSYVKIASKLSQIVKSE